MRLWSLHPRLLDRAALVAGWREGLLAQKVLRGQTRGYRHHPQLARFREGQAPDTLIAAFLGEIAKEATARGYTFNRALILAEPAPCPSLTVTTGQLELELDHLRVKVAARAPDWSPRLDGAAAHPLFRVIEGPIEPWERTSAEQLRPG